MTRKPLPKAIRRPLNDLRSFAAPLAVEDEVAEGRVGGRHGATDDSALAISSRPVANDPLPAASIRSQPLAAKRRKAAEAIVERHKYYAAGGGLIPVPIINVAGVTTVILWMVKRLSDLYEVPFERDQARSMVVGLVGGAVPTGLAAATTSTLAFAVPPSALIGVAVSSVSAAALTRGIGLVFIEHFEGAATPPDTALG